jgi:hypothetical protein
MSESPRVVARLLVGSVNNQPVWSPLEIEREVWQHYAQTRRGSWWDKPINPLVGVAVLALTGALCTAIVTHDYRPAEPLTLTGDLDD